MRAAVNYLLERIRQDPRLAYLIGPGSQAFELLIKEGAAHAGRDVDECRAEFEVGLRYAPWPSASDIEDRIRAAYEAGRGAPALPTLPQGWIWMRHPSRDGGQWLPAQILEEDGVRFYRPFDVKAEMYEWAERHLEWETYPRAAEPVAAGPLAADGSDR